MFSFRRKEPLKIVPFAETKPRTFATLLCDGVTARNVPSFAALRALYATFQVDNPRVMVLTSLDDLGQAGYTSGHCIEKHGLNDVAGEDIAALSSESLVDGEYGGYLSMPAEFPIRCANLLRQTDAVGFGDLCGLLEWDGEDAAYDLISANTNPDSALGIAMERDIVLQFVPVAVAADAIAAFPNGYFVADLNPMQNHALASYLDVRYGLKLFGVGARFLGFQSEMPLADEAADALAADLVSLYQGAPSQAASDLASLLTGRDWVLIRYTEG